MGVLSHAVTRCSLQAVQEVTTISFSDSVWDAAVFVGFSEFQAKISAQIIVCVFLNMLAEAVFVIVLNYSPNSFNGTNFPVAADANSWIDAAGEHRADLCAGNTGKLPALAVFQD